VMVARERDQGGVALHCTLGGGDLGDSISIERIGSPLIQLVRFRQQARRGQIRLVRATSPRQVNSPATPRPGPRS
jgi:hypothetical protein